METATFTQCRRIAGVASGFKGLYLLFIMGLTVADKKARKHSALTDIGICCKCILLIPDAFLNDLPVKLVTVCSSVFICWKEMTFEVETPTCIFLMAAKPTNAAGVLPIYGIVLS